MPKNTTRNTEQGKQLARDVASILANPETPRLLYDAIADAVTTMSEEIADDYWHSPEMIATTLAAYEQSERKRKGANDD